MDSNISLLWLVASGLACSDLLKTQCIQTVQYRWIYYQITAGVTSLHYSINSEAWTLPGRNLSLSICNEYINTFSLTNFLLINNFRAWDGNWMQSLEVRKDVARTTFKKETAITDKSLLEQLRSSLQCRVWKYRNNWSIAVLKRGDGAKCSDSLVIDCSSIELFATTISSTPLNLKIVSFNVSAVIVKAKNGITWVQSSNNTISTTFVSHLIYLLLSAIRTCTGWYMDMV